MNYKYAKLLRKLSEGWFHWKMALSALVCYTSHFPMFIIIIEAKTRKWKRRMNYIYVYAGRYIHRVANPGNGNTLHTKQCTSPRDTSQFLSFFALFLRFAQVANARSSGNNQPLTNTLFISFYSHFVPALHSATHCHILFYLWPRKLWINLLNLISGKYLNLNNCLDFCLLSLHLFQWFNWKNKWSGTRWPRIEVTDR